MTDHEGEPAMKVGNKLLGRQNLVLFAGKKAWRREVMASFGLPRHEKLKTESRGKICHWSNDVNRPVVGGNYLVRVRKQHSFKGNERGV